MDTTKAVPVLDAAVIASGEKKMCPVCGESKTSGAMVCKGCRHKLGDKATAAAEGTMRAIKSAQVGHKNALKTGNKRSVIRGGILASFRVPGNAEYVPASGKIESYVKVIIGVRGGYIEIFIFGASKEDIGSEITVIVELKTKENSRVLKLSEARRASLLAKMGNSANEITYLRLQKVEGATSNVKLVVAGKAEGIITEGVLSPSSFANLIPCLSEEGVRDDQEDKLVEGEVGFRLIK